MQISSYGHSQPARAEIRDASPDLGPAPSLLPITPGWPFPNPISYGAAYAHGTGVVNGPTALPPAPGGNGPPFAITSCLRDTNGILGKQKKMRRSGPTRSVGRPCWCPPGLVSPLARGHMKNQAGQLNCLSISESAAIWGPSFVSW